MTIPTNPKLVIVSEDQKNFARFSGLERFGWKIAPLVNKLGVSQSVKTEEPNVVVIWVGDPHLPAIRLLKALHGRQRLENVKVLLCSGMPLGQLMKVAKESGADGVLSQTLQVLNMNFELRQHIASS